ncbi:MAG: trigger factor [Longimicrobiales bacterium]
MDSDLKITIESPATWSRRLTITIPAERLEQEKQTTARQLASKIKLPGFRKGKVPSTVVERRFGPAIEQETIERVVGEAYREAIQREKLQPITQAAIDNIDYKAGSDLTFRVDFDVRPEVELNRLGAFRLRREVPPVTEEAVDRVLQRLREQHAVWHPVEGETPVLGDATRIEITPIENGAPQTARNYQVVMGEGQVRPEIEERIRTLRPGEVGEFELELPEKADDPASALKLHHMRVHLAEVRRPQFPALDDEFARSLGEFEDAAALLVRVRADLEREAETQSHQDVRRQLLDQILQANTFEVPASMVDRYLQQILQPRKGEEEARIRELHDAARPAAEQAIRRVMVIERVAEMEGLHATEEEIDTRYQELAQRYQRGAREIRAQLKKEGRDREVEEQITEEKVFRYLESLSTIE